MALYEFECKKCGSEFEKIVNKSRSAKADEVKCPECGSGEVKKLVSLVRSVRDFFCAPSG